MNTIGDINKTELRIIALIGVFVQLAVLGFDGIVTYRWGWGKGGYPVATYAFPLTLIGTLSVVVGMYLCANIVETKTQEIDWRRGTGSGTEYKPRKIQIIWLQKSQTVGDQRFKAFAIYAPAAADRIYLKTSHKKATTSRTLHSMTVAASVVSITGKLPSSVDLLPPS